MSVFRYCGLGILVLVALGPLTVGQEPEALPGPVLLDARKAGKLSDLAIRSKVQFDIFRPEGLKYENWIEYWIRRHKLPGGGESGVLAVYYNVSNPETYNGVWFKLGGADWSKYARGEIVLRVCRFEPLNQVRIIDETGKVLRDTECTDNFKVELKAGKKADGSPESFGIRYTVKSEDLRQQKEHGFFDARIPIAGFGLNEHLNRAIELVIVFEHRTVKGKVRGNLGLQAIVVVPERRQVIDLDKLQKKTEK
ncbi:MAG: hypothetical protein HYS12_20620 [Planctomycetes bacterium]|nr:hypothetical protein [Planctomycetota bacterium]